MQPIVSLLLAILFPGIPQGIETKKWGKAILLFFVTYFTMAFLIGFLLWLWGLYDAYKISKSKEQRITYNSILFGEFPQEFKNIEKKETQPTQDNQEKIKKTITEMKCTCHACGKVWHYRPTEEASKAAMKGCYACGTCGTPWAFFADKAGGKTLTEECPECHSKNFSCKEIKYETTK